PLAECATARGDANPQPYFSQLWSTDICSGPKYGCGFASPRAVAHSANGARNRQPTAPALGEIAGCDALPKPLITWLTQFHHKAGQRRRADAMRRSFSSCDTREHSENLCCHN